MKSLKAILMLVVFLSLASIGSSQQFRIKAKLGSVVDVLISATPNNNPQGNPYLIAFSGIAYPRPIGTVGLYTPGAPDASPIGFVYSNSGTQIAGSAALTSGNLFFPVCALPCSSGAGIRPDIAPGSYEFRLFQTDDFNQAPLAISGPVQVVPNPPSTPTGLTTTALSSTQIQLNWTDSTNEDTYHIERCSTPGCSNFTEIDSQPANITAYNNGGLTSSTSYSYRLRALNNGGYSGYSNTSTAVTQSVVSGNIRTVGINKQFQTITAAYNAANDGDTIEIDAGVYQDEYITVTKNNLTFKGIGGFAHMRWASGDYLNNQFGLHQLVPNEKGILLIQGNNTTIESMEFSGSAVFDKNGAGVRLEGDNLTIRNSYIHQNENGILTANNRPNSTVLVEFSRFDQNGYCPVDCGHNLYIGTIGRLIFRHNKSTSAKDGHTLKSRAEVSEVLYNYFSNKDSTASFEADFPEGGTVYFLGNVVEDGVNNDNVVQIAFANEAQSWPAQKFYVVNNSFYTNRGNSVYAIQANHGSPFLYIRNNVFGGNPNTLLGGAATFSNNCFASDSSLYSNAGAGDFRLSAGPGAANCANQGADIGVQNGYDLTPVWQYVDPASREARTLVGGAYDIGAFETTASAPTIPLAPNTLTATAVSYASIALQWNDLSSNESGFHIQRCTGQGCSGFTEIATTSANAIIFSDSSLSATTTYCYRVESFNGTGPSATFSPTACATTQAIPTGTTWTQLPNSSLRNKVNSSPWIIYPGTDGYSTIASTITDDWNGGIVDPTRQMLVLPAPGGHTSWFYNDVWGFTIAGGWQNLRQAYTPYINAVDHDDIDPVTPGNQPLLVYPDGSPSTNHTYDGMMYMPQIDSIIKIGGPFYGTLGSSMPPTLFNMTTHNWSYGTYQGHFNTNGGACVDLDENNSNVIWIRNEADMLSYNVVTDAYTTLTGFISGGRQFGYTTCIVKNGALWSFGTEGIWKNVPGQPTEHPVFTGDTIPPISAPGVAWEPLLNKAVVTAGGSDVYLVDFTALTITRVPASGDNPGYGPGPGTYKRFGRIGPGSYLLMNSIDAVFKLTLDLGGGTSSIINFAGSGDFGGVTANQISGTFNFSGANRLAVVGLLGDLVTGVDDVTGCKIAGIDMTLAAKLTSGFADTQARMLYFFYQLAPATGVQTVQCNTSTSHDLYLIINAYTGVKQTTQPDVVVTKQSVSPTASMLNTLVTTTTDKDWAVLLEQSIDDATSSAPGAGAGLIRRVSNSPYNNVTLFDSNGELTPQGAYTFTTTRNPPPSRRGISHIIVTFKPQ